MGAAAAAQLVAGDDFRGGLHDKNIVLKYEHRAACAKRCRAFQECAEFIDNIDFGKEDIDISFEVFSYKGDATNQEAIDKEKVHTSLVSALMFSSATSAHRGTDAYEPELFCQFIHRVSESGDLQVVREGTGAETHQLMLHEFNSVHLPTVDARCKEPPDNIVSVYCLGLDNGPDNQGMVKRISNVCLHVLSCM